MQIYFPSQDAVREDVILIISAISLFSASCHPFKPTPEVVRVLLHPRGGPQKMREWKASEAGMWAAK